MESKEQFDRQAKYYSSSKTFSSGESLKILSKLISKKNYNYGLDIGTGAGFAAFELTKYCKNVEATDISQGMIDEAIKICELLKTHFDGRMTAYYNMWIERCEFMKTQPLPKDWNGVFIATTK